MKKKITCLTLIFSMLFGFTTVSFAKENALYLGEDRIAVFLKEDVLIVKDKNTKTLVTFKEQSDKIITEMKNMDSGESEYFVLDKVNNTIYSSITNKTLQISDVVSSTSESNINLLRSTSSGDRYERTSSISYARLADLVSGGISVVNILAAIATLGVGGIIIETAKEAGIKIILAESLNLVINGVSNNLTENGITYTVWSYEKTVRKGSSGTYTFRQEYIKSLSFY